MAWIRRNWKWITPLSAAGLAVGIWLAFGWFGLHTLLFDQTVDETAPTFATTTAPGPVATSTSVAPGPVTLAGGSFIDRSHPTSGTAIVLGGDSGQRVLRLEDFKTDNGPDLFVYLSTAPADAPADDFDDDFVDLGVLKGNVGNQNYEIPPDVDLDRYRSVVIWCRRFTVAFGSAGLDS